MGQEEWVCEILSRVGENWKVYTRSDMTKILRKRICEKDIRVLVKRRLSQLLGSGLGILIPEVLELGFFKY